MLNILRYETLRTDGDARLSKLVNPVLKYETKYPGVLFDVEGKEDMRAVRQYYFDGHPHDKITGFVLPFDKLRDFANELRGAVPPNVQRLCTVRNELFFYGRLNDKVASSVYGYDVLPQEIRNDVQTIATTQNYHDKVASHKKMWSKVVTDKTLLFKVVNAFIPPQVNFDMTILESVGSLLFDTEDIGFNTAVYDYAIKLYHTGNRDIENSGRILCYPVHINRSFLQKKSNLDELARSIHDADPKGIAFKLVDVDDIRTEKSLIDNYNYFLKTIKSLSETLQVPSYYLSTHTEGLVALARGIDAFSQPFNRPHNVPRQVKFSPRVIKKMLEEDRKLTSGSIYNYRTKDMEKRRDFEKTVEMNGNVVNGPVGELSRITLEELKNMTNPRFRIYAKMYLMSLRNLEVKEMHDAIRDRNVRGMKSKFRVWVKDLSLFPS